MSEAESRDRLIAENERLRQRVRDAESVIESMNGIRDKAYEEIKQQLATCRALLREAGGGLTSCAICYGTGYVLQHDEENGTMDYLRCRCQSAAGGES